jgi:hypothetical protein
VGRAGEPPAAEPPPFAAPPSADLDAGFPWSVSLGTERLRAFLDLGVGFEGLLVGGLTPRF